MDITTKSIPPGKLDETVASAGSKKPSRPPRPARFEVGPFDDHGTARTVIERKAVEVEHGIPGEVVDALVYGKRRQWARITDILSPALDRVDAPCPHFHQGCGGCQWQMLSYGSQVERKRRHIASEMAAAGLNLQLDTFHEMRQPWRYRVTAGVSLGRNAGFRRHGTQSIVGLEDCPISHALIGAVARELNLAIAAGELPNYFGKVGVELRVAPRADGQARIHACVVPSPGSPHASVDAILPVADRLSSIEAVTGVLYRHRQAPPQLLFGEPFTPITICERIFYLSAATFFQTNMVLLPDLVNALLLGAAPTRSDRVLDIYGGAGLFGLLLAPSVGQVVEIEIDPVGAQAAQLSSQAQRLTNVSFMSGKAEAVMAGVEQADTIIVDPPRSGLTPRVIEAIGRLRPKRVLYVSCLPRSLARDVVSLQEFGYRPHGLQAFDFYPQTYHVELFSLLLLEP